MADESADPSQSTRRRRSRGIYLLPNLFTTSALGAGFYAVIEAHRGDYGTAAVAILVAMILDGFDGRVARMTGTTTEFGAEYDSMADMISFGLAPAYLVFAFSLSTLPEASFGQLGWVVAFVYTACCGLRLARFNVAVGTADKRFFQGLACPTAAVINASLVLVLGELGYAGEDIVALAAVVMLVTGLLMVSSFPYYSFKDLGATRKHPFAVALAVLLILVTTAIDPPKMILVAAVLYALSGPIWTLVRLSRRRSRLAARQ